MDVPSHVPSAQRFAADVNALIAELRARDLLNAPAYRPLMDAAAAFARLIVVMASQEQLFRELADNIRPEKTGLELADCAQRMRVQIQAEAICLEVALRSAARELGMPVTVEPPVNDWVM